LTEEWQLAHVGVRSVTFLSGPPLKADAGSIHSTKNANSATITLSEWDIADLLEEMVKGARCRQG
jgi:hypothetical protein